MYVEIAAQRKLRIKNAVLSHAVIPATMPAATASPLIPCPGKASIFGTSSTAAPAMIGVAIRNEKCAASLWRMPVNSPPTIAAPEREMPGMNAALWNTPINNAAARIRAPAT